jgi:hypothetical protein
MVSINVMNGSIVCSTLQREKGHEIFTSTYARHVSPRPKEEGTKWCEMLQVEAALCIEGHYKRASKM